MIIIIKHFQLYIDFDIENFNDWDSCIQSDLNPVINYLHSLKNAIMCAVKWKYSRKIDIYRFSETNSNITISDKLITKMGFEIEEKN